jgi:hypothetical protein
MEIANQRPVVSILLVTEGTNDLTFFVEDEDLNIIGFCNRRYILDVDLRA